MQIATLVCSLNCPVKEANVEDDSVNDSLDNQSKSLLSVSVLSDVMDDSIANITVESYRQSTPSSTPKRRRLHSIRERQSGNNLEIQEKLLEAVTELKYSSEKTHHCLEALLNVCTGILEKMTDLTASHQYPMSNPARRQPPLAPGSLPASGNCVEIPQELTTFCEAARENSLSVGHFATVLVKHLFSEEERKDRNCYGKRKELALDPAKLGLLKKLVYKYFPTREDEKEGVWKECVTCIDEFLRRKPRSTSSGGVSNPPTPSS